MNNTNSTDTWLRIETIIDEILDLSDEEVTLKLAELENNEPQVAKVVRAALQDPRVDHFDNGIEKLSTKLVKELFSKESEDKIGTNLGAFRLDELIGRGGMGVIYKATRVDGQFDQQVAIKKLPIGISSSRGTERFIEERAILAQVQHPYIAQLYDGGLDDSGLPYLVMELVDNAERIDHFVKDSVLNERKRLELFQHVCEAIAYLHQKLIIHGDIKPSNILVRQDGHLKLIDFGISHLISGQEKTSQKLLLGASPKFAPPEQLKGEALTTQSDIFSLGACLHAILSNGQETQHSTLSNVELQAIVSKCTRSSPNERYQSIAHLQTDLTAYLERKPVQAYSSSNSYRFKKYFSKHWLPIISTALTMVSLLVGIALSLHQARVAQNEALRASTVANFMTGIFEHSAETSSSDSNPTIQDLIYSADLKLENELSNTPNIKADLQDILGRAYSDLLSDYTKAEGHYIAVLEYLEQFEPENHDRILSILYKLAEANRLQGEPAKTKLYLDKGTELDLLDGKPDSTLWMEKAFYEERHGTTEEYIRALKMAENAYSRLYGESSNEMATVHSERGRLYYNQGDFKVSEGLYQQAIAMRERHGGSDWLSTVRMRNNFANTVQKLGRSDAAIALYENNIVSIENRLGPEHGKLVSSLNNLGMLYREMGDSRKATQHLVRGVNIASHQLPEKGFIRLVTELNLASALSLEGDSKESKKILNDIEGKAKDVFGDAHVLTAVVRQELARANLDLGNLPKASSHIKRSLSHLKGPNRLAIAHEVAAEILSAKGQFAESEIAIDKAIKNYAKADYPSVWRTTYARLLRSSIRRKQGKSVDEHSVKTDKSYLLENLNEPHRALKLAKL